MQIFVNLKISDTPNHGLPRLQRVQTNSSDEYCKRTTATFTAFARRIRGAYCR